MYRVMTRAKREETGSTILLVALAMVVLMGFAAFAVDIGNQYAHRREAQGAVDASVLAGAVESTLSGASEQTMVDEILSFVDTNLGETVTATQWLNDCPDTVNPADQLDDSANDLGLTPATDCISFSRTGTEVRTALPTRQLETYFAGVVGVNELKVNSFAHANIRYSGVANPPPFVVTSPTSGGQEVCLRTSSSGPALPPLWDGDGPNPPIVGSTPDPCDETAYNPDTRFFGTLKAYAYAPTPCGQPSGNTGISAVIADGIDHNLGAFGDYSPGDPEKVDGNGCPQDATPKLPNTMELQTGFTAQVLTLGLLTTNATTPRLLRSNLPSGVEFSGVEMDNTPLWHYLRTNVGAVASSGDCALVQNAYISGDGTVDYYDRKELMLNCLAGWSAGDAPLFDESLVDSSRFAWIPLLDEANLSGLVGGLVHINAFVPTFFQKLYQAGNSVGNPDPFCWVQDVSTPGGQGWYMHEAGQPFDCGRNNQNVDRLAAIVIDCGALPNTVCVAGSSSNPGGQPVLKVELSK